MRGTQGLLRTGEHQDRPTEHRQVPGAVRVGVRRTDEIRIRGGDSTDEKCRDIEALPAGEILAQQYGDFGVESNG
jgi:hypothetical protein